MTFDEVREANLRRFREIWPDEGDWTPADWLVCVTGELGEVANVLKDGRKKSLGYLEPANVSALADELADVFLYLDMLAWRCGIDLGVAVCAKFNKTSDKVGSAVKL